MACTPFVRGEKRSDEHARLPFSGCLAMRCDGLAVDDFRGSILFCFVLFCFVLISSTLSLLLSSTHFYALLLSSAALLCSADTTPPPPPQRFRGDGEGTKQSHDVIARLWSHEVLRAFYDRLNDDDDQLRLLGEVREMLRHHFGVDFDKLLRHLDTDESGDVDVNELRSLFFGDYMNGGERYEEVRELKALTRMVEAKLEEHNNSKDKHLDMVIFLFAIEHVSRLCRVLRMSGGHALLVGVGGSGRKSAAR